MNIKRLSLRFNLDNEPDCEAWQCLQAVNDSKNKVIVEAINAYFEQDSDLRQVIRRTIKECLNDISVVQKGVSIPVETMSTDEEVFMDSLDLFL